MIHYSISSTHYFQIIKFNCILWIFPLLFEYCFEFVWCHIGALIWTIISIYWSLICSFICHLTITDCYLIHSWTSTACALHGLLYFFSLPFSIFSLHPSNPKLQSLTLNPCDLWFCNQPELHPPASFHTSLLAISARVHLRAWTCAGAISTAQSHSPRDSPGMPMQSMDYNGSTTHGRSPNMAPSSLPAGQKDRRGELNCPLRGGSRWQFANRSSTAMMKTCCPRIRPACSNSFSWQFLKRRWKLYSLHTRNVAHKGHYWVLEKILCCPNRKSSNLWSMRMPVI